MGADLRVKAMPILEIQGAINDSNGTQAISCRNEAFRCLRRNDLVEALASRLSVESIRFGCQVGAIGMDPRTSFPIVHLDDGTNIKAKVLIGCDGSNSILAKSLGLEAPRLSPILGLRGFTNYPNGHIYNGNMVRLRKDRTVFGRIPIDDKQVYWFIAWRARPKDSEVDKVPQRIKELSLELLKEFPTDVIDTVEHCDLDSLTLTHIRYRAPWNFLFNNLRRGTITVAGDAMHVMGPFLGQGGSCGLEDAVVLGRCLARELQFSRDHGNNDQELKKRIEVALEDYVKQRRLRVMRLSTQSYLVGSMIAATSWIKRLACSFILKAFFGGMSLSHAHYDCGPL